MTQLNMLLELRNQVKSKKPSFIRQDYQRRKRLGRKLKWRKPKGIHSKIRHHFKGRRKMPSPGYKSPKKVRGFHSSGLRMELVFSVDDIKKIKKESEGAIISKNIGMKKRLEILKKSNELGIKVLNLNANDTIKRIEEFINSKKKKESKEMKKEEVKETRETKTKKSQQNLSDEQKKESEKREKDKLLIKKV